MSVPSRNPKSTTANRGAPGGLALPDKGLGDFGGWSALIQLPPFEAGEGQLTTVLRDNGASALALDDHPFEGVA